MSISEVSERISSLEDDKEMVWGAIKGVHQDLIVIKAEDCCNIKKVDVQKVLCYALNHIGHLLREANIELDNELTELEPEA